MCKVTFTPTSGKQKFCSLVCFYKAKAQKVMLRRQIPAVREQYNKNARAWREREASHVQAYERDRYHNDPVVNTKKKERARRKRFGTVDPMAVFQRDGNVCHYCQITTGKFHIDHMIPLSRGGTNTMDNLTVACQQCNLRKHTLTAAEFMSC